MKINESKKLSVARLRDAEALFTHKRYDGAVYICGYAIEIHLKHKICKRLKWSDYPPGNNFRDYASFKTHNLDILLSLTGKEIKMKKELLAEWSIVSKWNPETRYNATGSITKEDAKLMIDSTKNILKNI